MTDYFEYWNERIRRDLASFGDPGASVDVEGSARTFRAGWTMRGECREATCSVSQDEGVWVAANGASRVQYRAFVSGPGMADLRHVAQMTRSALKPMPFIPTRAESAGGPRPAIDVLSDLLAEEADTTRVMMVTGGAGAGKTSVLRELVRQQAEAYLSGRTSRLLLYVNAQGRALARLNEALATELQDLKVGLTYHSVAVLAQLGVLVPVIDGFDELLGVSGYDDAFSSLAEFLEQLHGEGQILASARSTYYEEEFLDRAGRATGDQTWSHESVRVLEWSDEDRRHYVDMCIEEKGWPPADAETLHRRVTSTFSGQQHAALASRPLFFTRVVDLLQRGVSFSGSDDLLQTLVREYTSRELSDKLLDRHSRPLMTSDQFGSLMQELAEEMWNQETRGLDVASIRFVAEYFVHDAGLPDDAKQVIVERLPTMAFLGRHDGSSAGGGIAFEHELFFYYFLARTIRARLDAEAADLRVILGRSALPEEVADRATEGVSGSDPAAGNRLRELLDRLSRAAETESRRAAQVRENVGLLVMALLRDAGDPNAHDVEDCTIRSVVFPGSHLRNVTLSRCTLIDVTLRRTDLTATRFIECDARDVRLYEPMVSRESTRLELKGLGVDDIAGIRAPGSQDANYDPAFVADTLRSCGAPLTGDPVPAGPTVPEAELRVMERLMRAYRRTNLVCLQDNKLSTLFSDYHWPPVRKRLVEHGIVKVEDRATSGRPKQFLRSRFLPGQIMAGRVGRPGTDPRIRAFWEALAASAA